MNIGHDTAADEQGEHMMHTHQKNQEEQGRRTQAKNFGVIGAPTVKFDHEIVHHDLWYDGKPIRIGRNTNADQRGDQMEHTRGKIPSKPLRGT